MPKFLNLPFILASSTPSGPDYVDAADWASVITNVIGQFSVANIVAVIRAQRYEHPYPCSPAS